MPLILLIIISILIICKYKKYIQSAYYQVTKNSPLQVYFDKGRLGEYMTYKYLREMEQAGAKFLFNLYVPKEDGETTEIDVLMIHPKGLFVFESKNYSGWIFGSENQRYWYQTLPQGRGGSHKETFYNPIMQNRTHIRNLKRFAGEEVPAYSIITFSDRCTLKRVEVQSQDIHVINRNNVCGTVMGICEQLQADSLSESRIQALYDDLYPYTQVGMTVKAQHVENIESNMKYVPNSRIMQSESTLEKKCPRCGGALVLRTAQKGANTGNLFYGCSNYPKCRYVQNIK